MTDVLTQSEPREARARAGRIRAGIQTYLDTLSDVAAAYGQRDWQALGYESWDAYVDGEYGADRLRLTPEHRQKAVAELRLAGMSVRAIGSAVGVDAKTVRNDLAGGEFSPPDVIQGVDGKTYAATRPTNPPTGTDASASSAAPFAQSDRPGFKAGEVESEIGTLSQSNLLGSGSTSPAETAAEVEVTPSADGTEANSGVALVSSPLAGESPVDCESVPAPAAAPANTPGAAAGVTPMPARSAPDPALTDEDAAMRGSHTFAQSLASLFLALDPDPIRWATNRWRPDAFPNRDLPRVRDAFTNDGLRTLADHLYSLADHLESNGSSL